MLALAYWHHAASLVISVALLGFGVAGTLLALVPRLKRPETLAWCSALYAVSIPASLAAARSVDFNILEVGWDPSQWLRLLALEAVFFVPFLVAALGIAVALALHADRPGGIYAANLLGSGAGALLAPPLLGAFAPDTVLSIFVCLVALVGLLGPRRVWVLAALGLVAGAFAVRGLEMSPFKDLPATPNHRIKQTRHGPFGRVDLVEAASLHVAPGLSLMAEAYPERQDGLFVDGHFVAALDRGSSAYLQRTVGALPFVLTGESQALLLGMGPELERASKVVDPNAELLRLAGAPVGVVAEPRRFLEEMAQPADLIVHHVPSLHAATETPLLTLEGVRLALARTSPEGGVALSCGLTTPPRAGLKLLATAEEVTRHIIAVRSADRLCVLLRHRPPTAAERKRVIAFCHENGFDPVRPLEWRFDEPYHETRTPLLDPGADYPYDVRPATDVRPYFFKFFKWSRVRDVFDPEQTSFVEWPFVALIVALLQVTALSLLLMVGPLVVSRAARAPAAVFVALGLGFMLLEMCFLQRAMVRMGNPIHAAAAVLGGFLVGAGLGSFVGERLGRPLRRAALLVVLLAPLGYVVLPPPPVWAALVCIVVAFPMGMPFPAALARVTARSAPWALAWNGCASVTAAAAAPLLSSTLGIPVTGGLALCFYLLLALFGRRPGLGLDAAVR